MEDLEEVVKKIYPIFKGETYIGNNKKMMKRTAFIKGAKWQQQRMYSEEDIRTAFIQGFNARFNMKDGVESLHEFLTNFKKQ